jgi:DNA-binding NarL/FixJ family response regulator
MGDKRLMAYAILGRTRSLKDGIITAMGKIKVLLAEDHIVVREGIRELIQRDEDMEVVGEAGDGEEAVQLASQVEPDIILMDIAMPGVDGIEATRRIKESHPSVGVLVLSAYDNEEFIFALVEAGAAGYLLKDVRGRELLNGIRAVYDGDSVLHPAIAGKIFRHLQLEREKTAMPERIEILSQRELEVLKLAMEGLSNKEIAQELNLGIRTIQTHWRNIFNKLGVSSRTEAIIYGLRKGWIILEQSRE